MYEFRSCLATNLKVTVRESYREPLWNSNTTTSHRLRCIRLTGEPHKKVAGLFAGSKMECKSRKVRCWDDAHVFNLEAGFTLWFDASLFLSHHVQADLCRCPKDPVSLDTLLPLCLSSLSLVLFL